MTHPTRTMMDIWTSLANQVELREIGDALTWLPFQNKEISEGRFIIRTAQDTPKDLAGAAATYRNGFPVIRGTELEILFEPEGFYLILGAGEQFNKGVGYARRLRRPTAPMKAPPVRRTIRG